MKIFAHIATGGKLLGWYNDEIHTNIPTPNIEVSKEAWQNAIDNGHNKVNADGSTALFDFRTSAEIAADRVSEIDFRLREIDRESLRPLRAISNGTATQIDTDKLAALDTEAEELRAERSSLVTA